jgi:preprotein translocase subunit SecD
MKSRNTILLVAIIILALISIYIDLPNSPGIHIALGPIKVDRDFVIKQGLDLQGGLQVLLEADLPADQPIEPSNCQASRTRKKPSPSFERPAC